MLLTSTHQMYSRRVRGLRKAVSAKTAIVLALLGISNTYAGQVAIAWDPQSDPKVAGYMIYYGQGSRNYTAKLDAGKSTSYTIPSLVDGKTYYFAVTAYDTAHTESGYSNEISRTLSASVPAAGFTANTTSGVAPLSVAFANTSSGTATSYSWNFGDGTTSTAPSPTHVYSTAGSYTVALTATGSGGSNTQTKANFVTVSSTPSTPPPTTTPTPDPTPTGAPVASFTTSATSGPAPLKVQFTSTSTGTVSAYAWNFGDGTSLNTAQNPSHTYWVPGTYTVSLRVTNSAGSNRQTKVGLITVGNKTSTRQGLVAAYSFDEGTGSTVTDKSGNNNAGTIANATWTTGRFGKALSFNGSNSMVSVADKTSLHLSTGMTLEAWVYPTAAMNAWRAIIVKEQPDDISYYLYASSDKNQPAAGNFIGAERTLYSGTQLPINAWTHLAATYDGSTQRLYVNGAQVATRTQTGAIQTSTNPLRIGGDSLWDEYFQGRIDEVRIYNRALSVSEIQTDMNQAVGGAQ